MLGVTAGSRPIALPILLALVALGAATAGATALALAWWSVGPGPPEATVEVGASATPGEEGDGWAPWDRNDDGQPVRWDPCSPLDLVVDTDGAYPGFRSDLADAVDEVAELSGLELRVLDEVDERPHVRREVHQPERYGDRWAPVLVAFARPGENELPLLDLDRGLAAPIAVGSPGDRVYVTGQVVLNVERDDLDPGVGSRDGSWGATLRHELGHLVGLDHVDDEQQLMYPHPVAGEVGWGDGDRRGLRALGGGGCLDVPEPRALEVELGPAHGHAKAADGARGLTRPSSPRRPGG